MNTNYESPVLNEVGDVSDVVLGIAFAGDDLDGQAVVVDFEFASDFDLEGI